MYDSRLGRWLSVDPLRIKYVDLTPYHFADNSPIRIKDGDGRDIIILCAPDGAGGYGHAAALIGNEKDGWTLYSKNGTLGSSGVEEGASGPSNKNPEIGVPFKTLKAFANSTSNFKLGEAGQVEYTSAFRIVTDGETDKKMKTAAAASVGSDYDVLNKNCIDVVSDALEAGGLKPGKSTTWVTLLLGKEDNKDPRPNERIKEIVKQNPAFNVTKSITPTDETKQLMKSESTETKNGEQKQADAKSNSTSTSEEFGQ